MRISFLVVCLVILANISVAPAQESNVVATSRAASMEQCVEPTNMMRRDHMDFLLHQRDQTVHEGIRTPKHSLIECIDCHAGKDDKDEFVPVNKEQQFCQTCHQSTAVKIDCFECHATTPDVKVSKTTAGSHNLINDLQLVKSDDVAVPLELYLRSFPLN